MTRLWIMSDLHQEWPDNAWDPQAQAPACDVVVVAGDVHTPGDRAIDWLADRLAGVPVVYVPGNHDFWVPEGSDPFTWNDMRLRMRERADARGISLLDDSTIMIHGVLFTGGTLWTDMCLRAWNRGHAWNVARRQMRDYHRIRRRRTGRHHQLRVEETVLLHQATVAHIDNALHERHAGRTVVVTHHAPTSQSVPISEDLPWCYGSDLNRLFGHPNPPYLWVHGHVHRHQAYGHGYSCVVANPRGHVEEAATSGFIEDMVVTV